MADTGEGAEIVSKIGPDLRPSSKRKYLAIVAAAREQFLEHGFSESSVDAIADSAGVSKRTVYKHFEDKQALFAAVVDWLCHKVPPPALEAIIENDPEPVSVLTEIGVHILTNIYTREQIELFRVAVTDARRFPEIGRMMFEQVTRTEHTIGSYLERLSKSGRIDLPCPDIAAAQFLGLLKTDMQMKLLFGDRKRITQPEIRHIAECCARLFLNGCGTGNA